MSFSFWYHKKTAKYTQVFRGLLLGFIMGICLSCVTHNSNSGGMANVWLSDTKYINVLPPNSLIENINSNLSIEASYQGQTYFMEALMQADSRECIVVGLNSFGTQIFEMDYDGVSIKMATALPIGAMKPEYLLADLQIAFYPNLAVATALQRAGFIFESEKSGASQTRKIFDGTQLLIQVAIAADTVIYTNYLRHYTYKIRIKDMT